MLKYSKEAGKFGIDREIRYVIKSICGATRYFKNEFLRIQNFETAKHLKPKKELTEDCPSNMQWNQDVVNSSISVDKVQKIQK